MLFKTARVFSLLGKDRSAKVYLKPNKGKKLAFETRHRYERVCVRVRVRFIFIVFFQFGFKRQRSYVRISPWQRSGVIGEWNGAEMICGRWLDHGLSMMTSLPFSSSSSLCPLGCFSRGMFRRKGCGSPLFRGLALTIRTDPDSPRYFYARMFKQPTLSRRVLPPPISDYWSKTLGRRRGRFAWNNGVEKERLRFVYRRHID